MKPAALSLEYRYHPPASKDSKGAFFLLHGYGSNEDDLFSFVPEMPQDFHYFSLQAPYSLDPFGYAWYAINFDAENGKWSDDGSYALELRYYLGLKGRKIAERSITEMRKIGYDNEEQLSSWLNMMKEIFPDVRDGSVLTGIFTADQETLFFNGDQKIGHVTDPLFGKAFFSIWLSDKTSEPELRQALMGLK